jgi:thiol-disulfide isomerase/thioredoxin
MFRISYSELSVRMILAIGFLLIGIMYVRARETGLPNTGSLVSDQAPTSLSIALQKEKSSAIIATNPADFKIASGQLQLVEFYAPGDPASEKTAQLMHSFEKRYHGKVNFVYLDVLDPRNKANLDKLNELFYPQFTLLGASGQILDQWTTTSDDKMGSAIAKASLVEPLW